MNVLMVGVDEGRNGGMWTVAESYIESKEYNSKVNLTYIATSTDGTKIKRVRIMLSGYLKIIKCLLFKKVDIVHVHMAEKGSTYRKGIVVKLAKAFRKKVIIQMHAGPFIDFFSKQSPMNKKLIINILNSVDKVLVLGEYWKNSLFTIVKPEKLIVLYNGAACPAINKYNVSGNIVLYLGLLKRAKGTYDLIEAINYIKDKLDNDTIVYLCGADEEGDFQDKIVQYHLEDKIKMLGWISKEKRDNLFNSTKMCVLPSYFEALSMTVIEAMCHGIPMVTTDISTMSELLGDEIEKVQPGDYKALGDLILKLDKNEELRAFYSDLEYQRAAELFTIDKNIKNTICIYNEVINGAS